MPVLIGGEFLLAALCSVYPGRRLRTIKGLTEAYVGNASGAVRRVQALYSGDGIFYPQNYAFVARGVTGAAVNVGTNTARAISGRLIDGESNKEILSRTSDWPDTSMLRGFNAIEGGWVLQNDQAGVFEFNYTSATPINIMVGIIGIEFLPGRA